MRRTTSTSRLGSGSRRPDVAPVAPPRRPAPPLISCSAAVSYTAPDADSGSSDPLKSVSAGISAINLGPKSIRAGLNNNGNDANRKGALGYLPEDKVSMGFAEGEREVRRSVRIQAAHPTAFPTNLRPFSPPPPSSFLEACFLCKRRLRPGNDIFMYRGDQAFCSIECRCHQIEADERKEKCRIASVKKGTGAPPSNPTTNGQQVGSSETAAVA